MPQFDQVQIADFLCALAARLNVLRPWPEPKFRQLEATWATFRHALPIARLNASILDVTNILRMGFRQVGGADPGTNVLLLKLVTGETVELLGSYRRGDDVTLLADASANPAEVIEHFIAATGIPSDRVR